MFCSSPISTHIPNSSHYTQQTLFSTNKPICTNMKQIGSKKMMRGFMCHSPAATAVCMTGDGRSVIVPRRPGRDIVESTRLISNNGNNKYSRVGVGGAPSNYRKRPIFVPHNEDHGEGPKSIVKRPQASPPRQDSGVFQVVVMRVSLHCQGCAGKVKKHLSKMEGVTSFSIELESKRVTVMGHVSPDGVLESISKVKRAEFWPC